MAAEVMSLSQSSSVSDGDADFIAKLVASCERAEQAPLATPAPKPVARPHGLEETPVLIGGQALGSPAGGPAGRLSLGSDGSGWDAVDELAVLQACEAAEAPATGQPAAATGASAAGAAPTGHVGPGPAGPARRAKRKLPSYLGGGGFTPKWKRTGSQKDPDCNTSLGQEYVSQLPMFRAPALVIVSETRADADLQCERLLKVAAKDHPTGVVRLGFDIEWKVTYKKGEGQRPTAMVQLASKDRCVLFRVCKMAAFPEKLRAILVDPAIYKAGVGITGDQLKLHRDFGLVVQGAVDLSVLANTVHKAQRWKLDQLCSSVLKKRMDKPTGTRCGDWEVKALNCDQRHYAAVDALVGQQLFAVLDDRRIATTDFGHRPINNPLKDKCPDFNGGGGGCRRADCPHAHLCSGCGGRHRASDCPAAVDRDPDSD